MWKNSEDFSKRDLARLLASPEAKALAAMLQQMDTDTLNKAAAAASQGNPEQAKELLSPLMGDPKVQELISRMEENNG